LVPTYLNGRRPQLLYVVHRAPYPPDKGDRIRAYQLLRYLAPKAAVHLACLADEPIEPQVLAALRPFCERIAVIPLGPLRWVRACGSLARGRTATQGAFSSPKLRAVLRHWARLTKFDACVASASSMVPYLRLAELQGVPAVVDLVDVDSQKWLDYAAASRGWRKWLYRLEAGRLRRLESKLPSWTRAATVVSDAEAEIYRQFAGHGRIEVVTNGVDLDYFHPLPEPNQAGCVFLGALDYRPNVDGVTWFCNEVWPLVLRSRPDATIHLVGRRPVPAVQRLAELPGVELVGQVPDVRPHLAKAAVAVVPLRIARGIQNKILEAMAMGKATVISPACLKGLSANPGQDLLVAATPQEWAESLVLLLNDAPLRSRLGAAARGYVTENHRWDRCLAPLDSLLGLEPTAAPALSSASQL